MIKIFEITEMSQKVYDAFERLLPQLSSSAKIPTWEELEDLINSKAGIVLAAGLFVLGGDVRACDNYPFVRGHSHHDLAFFALIFTTENKYSISGFNMDFTLTYFWLFANTYSHFLKYPPSLKHFRS